MQSIIGSNKAAPKKKDGKRSFKTNLGWQLPNQRVTRKEEGEEEEKEEINHFAQKQLDKCDGGALNERKGSRSLIASFKQSITVNIECEYKWSNRNDDMDYQW